MMLKAGAAASDVSPHGPVALFGYPHVQRISTGVHDPLLASVLYLENGSDSVILIALDLLFLDPPTARSIRRAVARRASVPEECVFISCTHTHSGPVTGRMLSWQDDPTIPAPDSTYLQFIEQQVVDAAGKAVSLARPVEIAWSTADARGVGGNRLDPNGVTDPEVGVLAVREAGGGEMLAVALIYGMHPTVLHEDSTLVSSDFPHYTRQHLQERFGENLTVVYHNAPCGNQSPRRFVDGQTFQEAERLGRKLGKAVVEGLEALQDGDFKSDCPLSGVLQEVELTRRAMPSVEDAQKQLDEYRARYERLKTQQADRAEVRTAECAVFGAEGTVTLARAQQQGQIDKTLQEYRPIQVQVLRIGDAYLVGLPGELFVEYSLEIKRLAPAKTFVVSLVGGELQGYIVTPQAAAAGGYEATNSIFAPESGTVLVLAACGLAAEQQCIAKPQAAI